MSRLSRFKESVKRAWEDDSVCFYMEWGNDNPPPPPPPPINVTQVRDLLEENIKLRQLLAKKEAKQIEAKYALLEEKE